VLEAIARYNLLAVPVVDGENRLEGIVTADDALDMILPDDLKVQLPRLF
jgi:magnesium transporter